VPSRLIGRFTAAYSYLPRALFRETSSLANAKAAHLSDFAIVIETVRDLSRGSHRANAFRTVALLKMRLLLHWSLLTLAAVHLALGFTPAELVAFAAPPTLLTPPPFASFGGVRFVELVAAADQPRVITRVPMRVRCPEGYHYHRKCCHPIVYYQQLNYNVLTQTSRSKFFASALRT
jgi:hypothetical protein